MYLLFYGFVDPICNGSCAQGVHLDEVSEPHTLPIDLHLAPQRDSRCGTGSRPVVGKGKPGANAVAWFNKICITCLLDVT